MKDRNAGKSHLCKKANHKHKKPAVQNSGHTEARIIDELGKNSPGGLQGGKLTLNIDWRPKKGGKSKMPCLTCHELLCLAATNCEIEIILCGKKDENGKHKQANMKDHCPANSTTQDKLKDALGEMD